MCDISQWKKHDLLFLSDQHNGLWTKPPSLGLLCGPVFVENSQVFKTAWYKSKSIYKTKLNFQS